MTRIREIKRYANRKLYDVATSKTMTLEDIADYIRQGYEIKVFDNLSGEDITSQTLSRTFLKIFVENENPDFSNFLLTTLIREVSGNIHLFFARLVQGGIGTTALTTDKLEKIVKKMVELGLVRITDRDNYLEDILSDLNAHRVKTDSRVKEGIGLMRRKMSGNQSEKIEELSERLNDIVRLIREL